MSLGTGVAAAQDGAGGTVVVEADETVSEVNAVGGAVIVRGTVTGDVNGFAGEVLITGTVEGDVSVAAGTLRIAGDVGGDVSAGAGSVVVEEGGTVGGNFDAGAGDVRIDGTIEGDARIGADRILLGESAVIAGSLTYDGRLGGNYDAVAGEITRDRMAGPSAFDDFQPFASWLFALYAFVANLLLGALLLALFPAFSDSVAEQAMTDPLRTGLVGLGVLIGVPVLLVVIALTIVGIPLTVAGAVVFALVVWTGLVYGRFALGAWLLSLADSRESFGGVHRRWVALVFGLALGGGLSLVPILGGLVDLVILLLGLGALSVRLYRRRRQRTRATPSNVTPDESPAG
ncbi:bactofilin family protein [Halosimplex sp. J119]